MPWVKGQSGNPEGRRAEKPWRDAIRRAIKRRETSDPQALEKIADALIEQAAGGKVDALKEFGDRVDGKVPQAIVGDDEADPVNVKVTTIKRVIVERAGDTNSPGVPPAPGTGTV